MEKYHTAKGTRPYAKPQPGEVHDYVRPEGVTVIELTPEQLEERQRTAAKFASRANGNGGNGRKH